MINLKKIIIVTSGTGGHIFPALSIANYLKYNGWDIFWLAPDGRLESELISKFKISIKFMNMFNVRKKKLKELLFFPFNILKILFKSVFFIKKYKPNIVLGMGGYFSGPVIFASWLCKIPTVIHEQNCIAGLTNKLLARIAKRVLQAFPNTLPRAILVGNPIREDILKLPNPNCRLEKKCNFIKILVIGGSQGSQIINKTLPEVVSKLKIKFLVWHQTGKNKKKEIKNLYKKLCNNLNIYRIDEFINDMAKAYSWANLVICRSGALTVSEISSVGLAAFFVPYTHKDNQQILNANTLCSIGAAKMFNEKFLTEMLIKSLNKLSHKKLLNMANKAYKKSFFNSAKVIAKIIINLSN